MRKLLEPIKIGNMELRNRVVLSAMAKYFCTNGYIGREYCEYYRNIAHGGTALIIPGIMCVEPKWYGQHEQPFLNDDKYIPGLKMAIDAVHEEGAKFACQLWMPGHLPYTQEDYPEQNGQKIAAVNYIPREMIPELQQKYVDAAVRCAKAGTDAIEWHMAHNYLPEQFYSPYFNHRTDEYGAQNVENAMRFSVEVIDRIKAACPGVEIIAKMNGSDFHEGTASMQWLGDAAVILEQHGVSMITVNGGGVISRLTGMSADGNEEEGWKVPYAEVVKKRVSIPVAACGSLRHPDFIDSIIEDGKCDLVALGRQLFAEPEFCNKIAEGREDELKFCVSCMHCLTKTKFGPNQPGCTVNPRGRREFCIPRELNVNGDGLPVAVVGAGPAGLEAAVTLAKRGFAVTLFDKSDKLGGNINLASMPIGKYKLGWMVGYYENMLRKLGVTVRLGTTCTPELLEELKPYAVFVATGSVEAIPPLPGIDGEGVIPVRTYLCERPEIKGERVVVLGAGQTGLEAARMLAVAGNEVTVVDMMPDEIPPITDHRLDLNYAREAGVTVLMAHKVARIEKDAVVVSDMATGEEKSLPRDKVIVALGVKSDRALYDEVKERFQNVFNLGDSDKPGMAVYAVSAGYLAAANLPAKDYVVDEVYFSDIDYRK